jgi:murein DD-endopeptidase MepM/ murein hydrolase activator NlpD
MCTYEAPAQKAVAIRSIRWAPHVLSFGSPCIFTVQLEGSAQAVTGHWIGQELVFARSKNPNVWFAVAGVDVEGKPGPQQLTIEVLVPGRAQLSASQAIDVMPSAYKTTTLRVAAKFTEPDAATLARIAADKQVKGNAFAHQMEEIAWRGNFLAPVNAITTETFGTRRVFNGETASIHRGLDYRAATGTAVHAANSGTVILAQELFYEGGFVVIDHGQHLMTMYMHLSHIGVVAGDSVRKGQKIGLSGATGRVTGPHLHFAVRWQGVYLDPAKLLRLQLNTLAPN